MTSRTTASACSAVPSPVASRTLVSPPSMSPSATCRCVPCCPPANPLADACPSLGQPDQVQWPWLRSLHYLQGGWWWSLEGLRPDLRRLLPPGHVQVRPLRGLQGCVHEPGRRGAVQQVQARYLARWLGHRRGLCRRRALPAGDDQGQDSDQPQRHLPRRLRCCAQADERHQG